jgi:hypothetical protein
MGWPSFFIEPSVDYDWRKLEVGGAFLPDFSYHSLRFGGTLGIGLSVLFLEAGGAYHRYLQLGELTAPDWFPLAKGSAYELEGRLGVTLGRGWALLGTVNRQVARFSLHPEPPYGYPHGTAQALEDRLLTAQLAVRFAALAKARK